MSKAVITDYTFPDLSIETQILEAAGLEVVSGQCKTPQDLIVLTASSDYVITQFAPIDADVIKSMSNCKVIVRYGIGYDNVDCETAKKKGIPVCNIPTYCIDEVADHTLSFILSMTRQLLANAKYVQNGKWGLGTDLSKMRGLYDSTVGIIGLGRIGQAVAKRLQGFGCRLIAYDPVVNSTQAASISCQLVDLDYLLSNSDIITLHCPSLPTTKNIINNSTLLKMKKGSLLINAGRGDLICAQALTEALITGHLAGAAIDVFSTEPVPNDSPLLDMDNVLITSHIASASPQSAKMLRETAAQIVVISSKGESLPNIVNGL
ncbi:MAG: C-terminal binding protein [Candidatus Poribacteria bacterium]|nr:C-terminal binding protein [Candidatus Poribacteria bacterium]